MGHRSNNVIEPHLWPMPMAWIQSKIPYVYVKCSNKRTTAIKNYSDNGNEGLACSNVYIPWAWHEVKPKEY